MKDAPNGKALSAPMVMVLKTRGRPPHCRTASFTPSTMPPKCVWQRLKSLVLLQMPMMGLL